MTTIDKNIINSYTRLFEGLNVRHKRELMERLKHTLKTQEKSKEADFFKTFGAFADPRSAEVITKEIKGNRQFWNKEFKL